MTVWVVRLSPQGEGEYWLAGWDGDPGRTYTPRCARRFKSKAAGERALAAGSVPFGRLFPGAEVVVADERHLAAPAAESP